MLSKKASWFELYVDDIKRATTFYELVLDTKLEPLGDPSDQNTINTVRIMA
jgi:predicted enzyme related to lactoylglutathione lyase